MKNNYVIINSDTIQKRIDELNKTFRIKSEEKQALKKLVYSDNTDEILLLDTEMYGLEVSIEELQNILSQSIPLNEELEKAFLAARKFNSLDGVVDIDIVIGYYPETKDLQGVFINSEDYISNLKLSI